MFAHPRPSSQIDVPEHQIVNWFPVVFALSMPEFPGQLCSDGTTPSIYRALRIIVCEYVAELYYSRPEPHSTPLWHPQIDLNSSKELPLQTP